MSKISIALALVIASLVAACGGSKPPISSDSTTCKRVVFCAIGYHTPPGNECTCVPD